MKKMMHIMFLSCKKATELVEKKLLIGLHMHERMQLFFHTSMCEACKKYASQSEEMDSLIKNHINHFNASGAENQDGHASLKKKIINSLEKIN